MILTVEYNQFTIDKHATNHKDTLKFYNHPND